MQLKLMQALKARNDAESALVSTRAAAGAEQQKMRDYYEARMADKQKEVMDLKLKNQELESHGNATHRTLVMPTASSYCGNASGRVYSVQPLCCHPSIESPNSLLLAYGSSQFK